ncbi:hypothetical protein KL918_002405 [Ogataea parapolymorpha]|nr:hypothetical protein KL918_002405 [Ogataea parapolymorpha]KAG7870385.1 hypothetical protein KL916_005002 [Ogataea parapolymorpha]
MTVTYSSVSISILEDMLLEIASEIISRSILDEKLLRQEYGMAQPGLVDEGDTAAGLVKKVRQNIGNSASGSSQSSAAATPQYSLEAPTAQMPTSSVSTARERLPVGVLLPTSTNVWEEGCGSEKERGCYNSETIVSTVLSYGSIGKEADGADYVQTALFGPSEDSSLHRRQAERCSTIVSCANYVHEGNKTYSIQ